MKLDKKYICNSIGCKNIWEKSVKAYVNTHLPDDIRHVDFIEMDEMWHFTRKKNKNFGSGSLSIDIAKRSLDFQLEVGVKRRIKNS